MNGSVDRHFTVIDGVAKECGQYDEAFAELLVEKHPTKLIYKHQVHWSGYEPDYRPKTAEQLAAAREGRERKADEKW